jgi:hypothetical protein
MARFRSFSEIVSTMIDRLKLSQPNLDTKPGTVSRDLFVDLPADQIARLYSSINLVSEKQSLATTVGRDLDRLASNFGTSRNTGSSASGIVVFCTNSLMTDISIPTGTVVTSKNGSKFKTIGNFVMSSADKNRLAANANRIRRALNIAGISSSYALEVPVQSVRPGTTGNVGSLQIINTDLAFPVSVTNLTAMVGGANKETDNSFRSRILSVFSGANIGTSSGYRNSILGVNGVLDALVVEPGSSLMLRDGTETIETGDGSDRIISSGTGGKVDIYVLGRKVQEVSESFIFTDLSGSGNISDERNDYTLGQAGQDPTRTSEERRVLAFKNGSLPVQPVDSMVSVTGSSSGLFTESYEDSDGVVYGNFELEKDLNPETGGSPFGFDKIHFISNTKIVEGEGLTKIGSFSSEALSFNDINEINQVYRDINETGENSEVSSAGNEFISLIHTPIIRVSQVQNKTTGEVYSVVDQNLDSDGLNTSGVIEISGRSLPTAADILSVNYTWRQVYDPYVDYAGSSSLSQFRDSSLTDSIDWSSTGGIFEEESVVTKSEDDLMFQVKLAYDISKVISVYKREEVESTISVVDTSGTTDLVGIELDSADEAIDNIVSIRRASDNLELYNTLAADGTFDARIIYLPSDSVGSIDDEVVVYYNKVELFDINKTDGSFYNNVVALPSEGVLDAEEVFDTVEDLYLSGDEVYATYVADISIVHPSTSLSNLPITGGEASNTLLGLEGSGSSTNQPVFFEYDSGGDPHSIIKFGPANLDIKVSGISKPGKIKVSGVTLNRYTVDVTAGTAMSGFVFDIESELKTALDLTSIPSNMGIARVDKVCLLDSYGEIDKEFNILGYYLNDITYDIGSAQADSDLDNSHFTLPSTSTNSAISISSGDTIRVELLVYNTEGYEELYYSSSELRTTSNRFARIDRVSVSSGFRSVTGNLIGSVEIMMSSQPKSGSTYYVDYDFLAPKEGERITVSYNVNKLIADATVEIERVRPVTADILVKEAEDLTVDVEGMLLINEEALGEADKIVENVINSVTNIINTSSLGSIVDYSDIIAVAAGESGVDSVNISLFNESGKTGRKAFIKALDNQTISPGTVIFEATSRNKFRIN